MGGGPVHWLHVRTVASAASRRLRARERIRRLEGGRTDESGNVVPPWRLHQAERSERLLNESLEPITVLVRQGRVRTITVPVY